MVVAQERPKRGGVERALGSRRGITRALPKGGQTEWAAEEEGLFSAAQVDPVNVIFVRGKNRSLRT